MTFAIETLTKAKLEDVRVLSQKNRQPDQNPGVQLPLSVKLSNHVLAKLDVSLKGFLFTKNGADTPTANRRNDNSTGTLDGVEAVSDLPDLSSIGRRLKHFPWDDEVTGGVLEVAFATTKLTLDDCVARAFRIQPQEGGTVQLKFIVEAPDASEKVFAKLAKFKSREVEITFVQHEPAQQEINGGPGDSDDEGQIDGKPAAPRKPGAPERAAVAKAGKGKAEEPGREATEHFARAHGDDAALPVKNGATLSSEAAWPFPTGKKADTEKPPQSVTTEVVIETSRPGTRTARGRDRMKAALARRDGAAS